MAQQRHAIIFGINQDPTVDRRPLKLVGKLYDQVNLFKNFFHI